MRHIPLQSGVIRGMSVKFSVALLVWMLLAISASKSLAYSVKELSLEKKVAASDTVVIGRVVAVTSDDRSGGYDKFAAVQIGIVLKGAPAARIQVLENGPGVEDVPDCCRIGNEYLFFLQHGNEDRYFSVNERYGIYLIK
jgi:hypothetical protein